MKLACFSEGGIWDCWRLNCHFLMRHKSSTKQAVNLKFQKTLPQVLRTAVCRQLCPPWSCGTEPKYSETPRKGGPKLPRQASMLRVLLAAHGVLSLVRSPLEEKFQTEKHTKMQKLNTVVWVTVGFWVLLQAGISIVTLTGGECSGAGHSLGKNQFAHVSGVIDLVLKRVAWIPDNWPLICCISEGTTLTPGRTCQLMKKPQMAPPRYNSGHIK